MISKRFVGRIIFYDVKITLKLSIIDENNDEFFLNVASIERDIYIERRGRTDTREQRVEIVKKNGGKVKQRSTRPK